MSEHVQDRFWTKKVQKADSKQNYMGHDERLNVELEPLSRNHSKHHIIRPLGPYTTAIKLCVMIHLSWC